MDRQIFLLFAARDNSSTVTTTKTIRTSNHGSADGTGSRSPSHSSSGGGGGRSMRLSSSGAADGSTSTSARRTSSSTSGGGRDISREYVDDLLTTGGANTGSSMSSQVNRAF